MLPQSYGIMGLMSELTPGKLTPGNGLSCWLCSARDSRHDTRIAQGYSCSMEKAIFAAKLKGVIWKHPGGCPAVEETGPTAEDLFRQRNRNSQP